MAEPPKEQKPTPVDKEVDYLAKIAKDHGMKTSDLIKLMEKMETAKRISAREEGGQTRDSQEIDLLDGYGFLEEKAIKREEDSLAAGMEGETAEPKRTIDLQDEKTQKEFENLPDLDDIQLRAQINEWRKHGTGEGGMISGEIFSLNGDNILRAYEKAEQNKHYLKCFLAEVREGKSAKDRLDWDGIEKIIPKQIEDLPVSVLKRAKSVITMDMYNEGRRLNSHVAEDTGLEYETYRKPSKEEVKQSNIDLAGRLQALIKIFGPTLAFPYNEPGAKNDPQEFSIDLLGMYKVLVESSLDRKDAYNYRNALI